MSYFAPHCPVHAARILLDSSCIVALHPHPSGGVSIDFRCWCGFTGTLLPAGEVVASVGGRTLVGATAG